MITLYEGAEDSFSLSISPTVVTKERCGTSRACRIHSKRDLSLLRDVHSGHHGNQVLALPMPWLIQLSVLDQIVPAFQPRTFTAMILGTSDGETRHSILTPSQAFSEALSSSDTRSSFLEMVYESLYGIAYPSGLKSGPTSR
jgi:hypothetical protein